MTDRDRILAVCSSSERALWTFLFDEPFPATLAAPEPEWQAVPASPGSAPCAEQERRYNREWRRRNVGTQGDIRGRPRRQAA